MLLFFSAKTYWSFHIIDCGRCSLCSRYGTYSEVGPVSSVIISSEVISIELSTEIYSTNGLSMCWLWSKVVQAISICASCWFSWSLNPSSNSSLSKCSARHKVNCWSSLFLYPLIFAWHACWRWIVFFMKICLTEWS